MQFKKDKSYESVEKAKIKIENLNIRPANKEAILGFSDFCFSEGLSAVRVLKYLGILPTIARRLRICFSDVKRADIEHIVNEIERSDYSEWTKHDYKVALKKFFKWLRRSEDGYPPEVKWIRTTMRRNRTKLPEDILTPEEVQSMIVSARSVRDRAFIASLYESGCRITEIISLKIKHIQQHPHGFQITVKSMKGSRRILLISSAPYLAQWLNEHPGYERPDSPLWITSNVNSNQLCQGRIRTILQTTARKAGIRKAVNPHNFRHSRATHLANHLTEAQMNEYFGWVQGSDMPSTYVHLSGRDVDNALLKIYGIESGKDASSSETILKPKKCPRCGIENPATNRFCECCWLPLTTEAGLERENQKAGFDRIASVLIRDRDMFRLMVKKIGSNPELRGELERLINGINAGEGE